MGSKQIAQSVLLSSDGVDPCLVIVVFLADNQIYIHHLTSVELPVQVGYYWAQNALETILTRLDEKVVETNGDQEIVDVCLLGGKYKRNEDMTNLGIMIKRLCSTPLETLLFKTDYAKADRLLDFKNKVRYVDLNMNLQPERTNQGQDIDRSYLTVIAESINGIRRVSIAVFYEEKLLIVYVLDATKSRPNLCFKLANGQLTPFVAMVQNQKRDFIDYSFVNLLVAGSLHRRLYAEPTLQHILNNLLPNVMLDNRNSNDSSSSEIEGVGVVSSYIHFFYPHPHPITEVRTHK